jgi:hypothetical protein
VDPADIVSNETFDWSRVILGVFITPLVGALITILTARVGVGGQASRVDLLDRQLTLLERLHNSSIVSNELRQQVLDRANSLCIDVLAIAKVDDDDDDDRSTEAASKASPPWERRSWSGRYLLLPPRGLVGWLFVALYYYFVLMLIIPVGSLFLAFSPPFTFELMFVGLGFAVGICLVLFALRSGVRWAYNRAGAIAGSRRSVRDYVLPAE